MSFSASRIPLRRDMLKSGGPQQEVQQMRIDRSTHVSGAVWFACSAVFVLTLWAMPPAAAKPGAPPFCVLKGGPRGYPLPQICRFYDYQQCLQAAADLNGNCVVNIDYDGTVPAPVPPRRRQRY
jgi:hypothetical protein